MTAFPSSARQFNAAPSSLPPESLTRFFFPPIRSSFLDKFYPAFLFLFSFFLPPPLFPFTASLVQMHGTTRTTADSFLRSRKCVGKK